MLRILQLLSRLRRSPATDDTQHPTLGRLLWPLGLLIGGLVAIIAVLLLFAAREQNELAARASEHLARGVLAAEADAMRNQVRDYGTWTEAVVRLLTQFDAAWADENIGTWGYEGLAMDATLVIAGNDEVIYGMAEGEFVGHTIVERFGNGLQELVDATQERVMLPGGLPGSGLGISAYLLMDGLPALVAAAPIIHTDGKRPHPHRPPALLIFVRKLDGATLDPMARRYLLKGLRLVPPLERPEEVGVGLTSAAGAIVARLVWEPDKPGFATIRPLLLPGALSVLVVGFLLLLVVRHAQRTVRGLEQSHHTLEQLTLSLAAARDQAQQQARVEVDLREQAIAANRAKSEFLALVSHELRTPLNAILGFSETIASQIFGKGATERYRDYARDIHESGSHLLSIINDILDLSKVEAGRYELHEENVDLGDAVGRCTDLLRERALQRRLSLICRPSEIRLHADPRALKQIVFNLLSNAIKFTDAGGVVETSAAVGVDSIQVVVSDTGIGMSEEDLARACQPFGQAASSYTRSAGGTGLGLNVTRALIALHGGRLELRSTPGKGTVATVHLPLERLLYGPLADAVGAN